MNKIHFLKASSKVFIIAIFLLLVFSICFLMGGSTTNPQNPQLKPIQIEPAHFEEGMTTIVKTFSVSSKGGLFAVGNLSTPIDGTKINIPAGALDKEVDVSLGFNDGKITVPDGKSSGVALVLKADDIYEFAKPVTITVRFDPSLRPNTIVGYQIDGQGRFHTVDFAGINKMIGTVSFNTYRPLTLTWVYIMEY